MVNKREVHRYINDARHMSHLLCKKFHTNYPMSAWIQSKVPQKGYLDRDIEYYYHGHGCTFTKKTQDNYELNLDYWNNYIVLDPGKIYHFIENSFANDIAALEEILHLIEQCEGVILRDTIFGEKNLISIY